MIYLDQQGRYLDAGGGRSRPMQATRRPPSWASWSARRATFAWKCAGLDAAGLRATVGASAMTLGGMLKHLARFEDDMSAEWLHGQAQRPVERGGLGRRPRLGLALGR